MNIIFKTSEMFSNVLFKILIFNAMNVFTCVNYFHVYNANLMRWFTKSILSISKFCSRLFFIALYSLKKGLLAPTRRRWLIMPTIYFTLKNNDGFSYGCCYLLKCCTGDVKILLFLFSCAHNNDFLISRYSLTIDTDKLKREKRAKFLAVIVRANYLSV